MAVVRAAYGMSNPVCQGNYSVARKSQNMHLSGLLVFDTLAYRLFATRQSLL